MAVNPDPAMATDTAQSRDNYLVIKLGALGDFVQALGPFAAIRSHHRGAHITLLTTAPFEGLARASGYFDDVWVDNRPGTLDLAGWLVLRARLRAGNFKRVYDLQTSDRSSFLSRLFWPGVGPEWSGIARGASHRHTNPRRDFMHSLERQAEQLKIAGIDDVPPPDVSWVGADVERFDLSGQYALLLAGGAAHRPAKRWPVDHFAALGQWLAGHGVMPVLIGSAGEADDLEKIVAKCPAARTLAGETGLADIVALARGAVVAIGNDTGPMHLCAAAGCPSVVLFSGQSDPALCAPRGADVTILRQSDLADLTVERVRSAAGNALGP